MSSDEFLLVVALMDVTDMAAIQDFVFSTGFLVFDQVKAVKGFATDTNQRKTMCWPR